MKKITLRILVSVLTLLFCLGITGAKGAFAEEEQSEQTNSGTTISLTPVSKILQINSNSVYEDSFKVNNDGSTEMKIEVYSAPYSYIYSEEEDSYKLGFSNDNNYTQITRWISFKDSSGNWAERPTFTIAPNDALDITYRIVTPESIPSGGQYAVIFAHTLTSVTTASGIRTEASPGLVVYGRSLEGETIVSTEISDLKIEQSKNENGDVKNVFFGSAKVKNNGNVDFNARGVLKVEGIFSGVHYETDQMRGRVSVIPDAELTVSDEWTDTPSFGIFKVTWTVTAGDKEETIERIIFLMPPFLIIIVLVVLTILIIWIIMGIRKRKERKSRLAV